MAVDFKLIGKRMQHRRKALGKTQEHLAEYLDVSVGYVSNMERGATKISLTTLARISDFLTCDMADLISQTSTGSRSYLSDELNELIHSLTNDEKNTLLTLLRAYKSAHDQ